MNCHHYSTSPISSIASNTLRHARSFSFSLRRRRRHGVDEASKLLMIDTDFLKVVFEMEMMPLVNGSKHETKYPATFLFSLRMMQPKGENAPRDQRHGGWGNCISCEDLRVWRIPSCQVTWSIAENRNVSEYVGRSFKLSLARLDGWRRRSKMLEST